ncbi:hypothetical protein LshimejAT787_1000760 [Lyophyllum shimeji]|uniref:F-box domain-containing protein n=1 Tax=Lyophyllum shimeji TaxID=47721 RepID=A0A9P3PUH3_LYOSH|nr:hypothetical protein LshimejAT787_1000760 [Lyophyllum shimeji]
MITSYPVDLLLEILACLNLSDTLSFLSVCSTFRGLRDDRILWITVLQRTQLTRPLACPVGTNLAHLDLHALQHIAYRTHRLEKNWHCDRPRIGLVKTLTFENRVRAVKTIPGTSLIVIMERLGGGRRNLNIICHDIETGKSAQVLVPLIRRVARFDGYGRHLIAMLQYKAYNGDDQDCSLAVLEITYSQGKTPCINVIYERPLPAQQWYYAELFITADHVGVLSERGTQITVINMTTNCSFNIPVTKPDNIRPFWPRSLKSSDLIRFPPLLSLSSEELALHVYSEDPLNYDGDILHLERIAEVPRSKRANTSLNPLTPYDDHLFWSPIGLHMLTCATFQYASPKHAVIEVQYWPRAYPGSPRLVEQPVNLQLTGTTRGRTWSSSGAYAVIRREVTDDSGHYQRVFTLLHFVADPDPAIHSRDLDLPDIVETRRVSWLAIEERCGVIYLVLGPVSVSPVARTARDTLRGTGAPKHAQPFLHTTFTLNGRSDAF